MSDEPEALPTLRELFEGIVELSTPSKSVRLRAETARIRLPIPGVVALEVRVKVPEFLHWSVRVHVEFGSAREHHIWDMGTLDQHAVHIPAGIVWVMVPFREVS